MDFILKSAYQPTGDQPEAIDALARGILQNEKHQTLLGVTGSGKTFTIANVIAKVNRPTLILSHNKTLAAQLYGEFKEFFPDNAVEYFVSYYDYYQPEAYIASTDTYIEKDLAINSDLEKMRLSTTTALLSGRRDVIVVSSVSCLYGIGNPTTFHESVIVLHVAQKLDLTEFLRLLVDALYTRNEVSFDRGNFRVKGDTVDIYLAYADYACRIIFFGDEIESIEYFDPINGLTIESIEEIMIYPANIFITSKSQTERAIRMIQDDLLIESKEFENNGREIEAKRLMQRVTYDMEMIKELGYCPGIENYSRYFDGRPEGSKPFCLLDYFPDDFLLVIDESHVTIPQIHAMYGGDRSRKNSLIEYGFRLRAARDNRPLKFEEFQQMTNQVIYVSATPADYELEKSGGAFVEQIVRPTGLLDPEIVVRPIANQVDDLIGEINKRIEKKERTLVTTLTKRMAEELSDYITRMGISCAYIHSDVETLDRVKIMEQLREGTFDVLIGVNLLREGLDLPEVSLVAILDADKEGFLRSERSLTQTVGRAARNLNGMAIMYADSITQSMQACIDATNRRRSIQQRYNTEHNIVPQALNKKITQNALSQNIVGKYDRKEQELQEIHEEELTGETLKQAIERARRKMKEASKAMNFIEAAQFRDELFALEAIEKKQIAPSAK